MLELYFDTDYADKARLLIVDTFIVARKFEEAETFLEENGGGFTDVAVLEEAKILIKKNRSEEEK